MDPLSYHYATQKVKVHEALASDCDFEDALSYALKCMGKEDHSSFSSSRKCVQLIRMQGNSVCRYLRPLSCRPLNLQAW